MLHVRVVSLATLAGQLADRLAATPEVATGSSFGPCRGIAIKEERDELTKALGSCRLLHPHPAEPSGGRRDGRRAARAGLRRLPGGDRVHRSPLRREVRPVPLPACGPRPARGAASAGAP